MCENFRDNVRENRKFDSFSVVYPPPALSLQAPKFKCFNIMLIITDSQDLKELWRKQT